ncbi:MAG: hypothetical protein HA496_01300 [Thaumarchaeota archaeon]|jgi:hypothetical protein|nr:hypothetical protein [Nitrososphaerota archaeon]
MQRFHTTRGLRKTPLTLLVWILLAHILVSVPGKGETAEYDFPRVNILEGDIFIVTFSPPAENIQVYVKGSETKDFSLLVLTNSSLNIPILTGRASIVQLIPQSPVTNLTVTFNSNTSLKIIYGILTGNYTYYRQVSSEYYTFSNGILVILQPQITIPRGPSKITFILNRFGVKSSSGFPIELPPLATLIPFIAVVAILAYLNAYVLVDSYYLSKREELGRLRKIGIVLLIVLSALIIYWLLNNFVKY